jgi:hypothetical protein
MINLNRLFLCFFIVRYSYAHKWNKLPKQKFKYLSLLVFHKNINFFYIIKKHQKFLLKNTKLELKISNSKIKLKKIIYVYFNKQNLALNIKFSTLLNLFLN